jgi:ribulose-5-phosphate 4-epimerase/fuculose-1-phosphate aldolase
MKNSVSEWIPQKANDCECKRVLALADSPQALEQKKNLVAGFRILAQMGLSSGLYQGLYGHISLRVPHAPDYFWVNQFGTSFSEIEVGDLVLISKDGFVIEEEKEYNSAAFFIHSTIHAKRPDVHCVVHTHPAAGCAFSALGLLLEPIDQVGCIFFEEHALHSEYTGIVNEQKQGDDLVASLGSKRALILSNHGLLTVASTISW